MGGMRLADEELITIARQVAAARGYPATLDAKVTIEAAGASVLLSDRAYARGGGLLVVIDPDSGVVLDAVRQL
jgi:hypothetical protein